MMPGFSTPSWIDHYLKNWRQTTILKDGTSLQEALNELESATEIRSDYNTQQKAVVLKLRKDLYGHAEIEQISSDLQLELTRLNLEISLEKWEALEPEAQAKLVASNVIKNDLQLVDRYRDLVESNKRNESANQNSRKLSK